jgi:putative tricarboxylic transport membrane protein
VRTDSALQTGADLLGRLGNDAAQVTVALSTALGNPNHVAFAKLVQQAGGNVNAPTVRVFDTALDAVADVVAGSADVAAVTAASVLTELNAGRLRLLAVSAPARLPAPFAATQTWKEQSADCVIGAWRGVTGPAGLTADQVRFWEGILRKTIVQPIWQAELKRLSWSPMYRDGADLLGYLESERREFAAVLAELGLLKRRA